MMLAHFNSPDVQARIKNELMNLNFAEIVKQERSKTKALSKMASHIANRAPKCPEAYKHEPHRVDFLKKALMKESWSKTILIEINEHTNYQSLYTKLANARQLHEESSEISVNKFNNQQESKPAIFFTQTKYGLTRQVGSFLEQKTIARVGIVDEKDTVTTNVTLPKIRSVLQHQRHSF